MLVLTEVAFKYVLIPLLPPSCILLSVHGCFAMVFAVCAFLLTLGLANFSKSSASFVLVGSFASTLVAAYSIYFQPYYEITKEEVFKMNLPLIAGTFCLAWCKYLGFRLKREEAVYYCCWLDCSVAACGVKWLACGSCLVILSSFNATKLVFISLCFWEQESPFSLPNCPEIFFNKHHALCFSCGIFSMIGGLLTAGSLIRQLVRFFLLQTRLRLVTESA